MGGFPGHCAVNILSQNANLRGSPAGRVLTSGPLVVVAGIPGAGKSTALEKFMADLHAGSASNRWPGGDPVVLDSASVRRWLCSRLPQVPYPVLRPVVHTIYWVGVLALILTEPRPLVVHETATRPLARLALRVLARCGQRPARLVWIDALAQDALRGQIDRGRIIRPHAFARHLHRIEQAHPATTAQHTWDTVCITDRGDAPAAILTACSPTC